MLDNINLKYSMEICAVYCAKIVILFIYFHSSWINITTIIVSPVRSTYGGYYGLVVVTPPPRPQTLHRSHDNLKNPYRIASIFYM